MKSVANSSYLILMAFLSLIDPSTAGCDEGLKNKTWVMFKDESLSLVLAGDLKGSMNCTIEYYKIYNWSTHLQANDNWTGLMNPFKLCNIIPTNKPECQGKPEEVPLYYFRCFMGKAMDLDLEGCGDYENLRSIYLRMPLQNSTPATSTKPQLSTTPSVAPSRPKEPPLCTTPSPSTAPSLSTAPLSSTEPSLSKTPSLPTTTPPSPSVAPARSTKPQLSTTPSVAPSRPKEPPLSTTPSPSVAPSPSTAPSLSTEPSPSTRSALSITPSPSTAPVPSTGPLLSVTPTLCMAFQPETSGTAATSTSADHTGYNDPKNAGGNCTDPFNPEKRATHRNDEGVLVLKTLVVVFGISTIVGPVLMWLYMRQKVKMYTEQEVQEDTLL